ncbi:MAG: hypothetical protein IJ105_02065 [Bacilli bacterium]|nr:hypothetical protein [Bacilli bacterium]
MEKDLFYILQNIKVDINSLNINYLQDRLVKLNFDCMYEEDNFDYYNKKLFINNIKFLLTKLLMLGRCTKNQINKYNLTRQSLEKNLDKIEDNYNYLLAEYVVTEVFLEINKTKEITLKNNYNQIDSFLEFINKMSKEEKDKIFSYKMGVNNG